MKTNNSKIGKSNNFIIWSLTAVYCILFASLSATAQIVDPLIDINAQLRALFSPLARPNPSKLFLYDMAAHKVDEKYFCNSCPDTITTNYWYALYDEMYHSAYDTSTITTGDDVFDQATQIGPDTITIGLMDYDYYTIKDTALNSDLYFDYDTVNTILTDKTNRPGYPFDEHNLFSAAPLWNQAYFTDVVFRIDPDYLFIDGFNTHYYSGIDPLDFKIDFGDGDGYITFDPTVVTYHTANYHSSGYYYIKTALFDGSTRVKYSVSVFKVMSNSTSEAADEYIDDLPGMSVGVYEPCNGMPADKFIIYLPGWDALDLIGTGSRSVSLIYDEMIKKSGIVQLRNFGYSFVVVDWADSREDIRINAMYLVNLIKYLKCRLADMDNHHQQFVVIGESMGGLVARYALTYMENVNYDHEGECYPEKLHNVRLMITLDTPHQGANVPLSVQNLYHDFINFGPLFPKLSSVLFKQMDILLDGQAAKQMLIYHLGGHTPNLFGNDPYTAHSERDDFVNDLYSIGNYPQFCKKVALSNGSMEGEKIKRSYGSNPSDRYPGDYFMDFEVEVYVRFVGFKIKVFGIDLEVQSNPDPGGQIMLADAGTWVPIIKLKR